MAIVITSRRPRHAPRPLPTPLRALSRPPALRTRQAPAPPLRGPPLELRLRRPERNDEEPDRRGDQEDRSKSARRLRESDQGGDPLDRSLRAGGRGQAAQKNRGTARLPVLTIRPYRLRGRDRP